ncbi:hypothetical protein CITSP_02457 [Citrobacter sp. T1.2D-1]|nr:hypothetical protein CITSP_02457 [Citrobacter sp. T1.2D-1]
MSHIFPTHINNPFFPFFILSRNIDTGQSHVSKRI